MKVEKGKFYDIGKRANRKEKKTTRGKKRMETSRRSKKVSLLHDLVSQKSIPLTVRL